MTCSCFHFIRLNSKLYLQWVTVLKLHGVAMGYKKRGGGKYFKTFELENEKWPFVHANWLSNVNKLAFRKTYKEGTRWEVCGWPWKKVAVSGRHEAVFTTWKTLERGATTLHWLYHRSPTKITVKEVLRSVIVLSKGRERNCPLLLTASLHTKWKNVRHTEAEYLHLEKTHFPFFDRCICIFLRLCTTSLSLSLSMFVPPYQNF